MQEAQVRRDIEERERIQTDALREQEEAIRRLEVTQERMRANSQELARQSAEQARTNTYLNSTPATPALLPLAPAASLPVGQARRDPIGAINFAPLTERLKSYFGTQSGVLVVNAGGDAPFSLQDGDVIISIDGRVPVDGPHATSILRSYRPGERVQMRVQRDRRVISLDTTAPGQPDK
jgi:S1-C subfamily serine protease